MENAHDYLLWRVCQERTVSGDCEAVELLGEVLNLEL
jgi:hypothetical protein